MILLFQWFFRHNLGFVNNNNNNNNNFFAPGDLLKTAPKGNGVVTLKCYRNALKEEAGFAWVTRNGRQTLAYLP